MSVIVLSRVFWSQFKDIQFQDKTGKTVKIGRDTSKLVMLAIADSADDYGENSWQSFETIAEKASIERRSVMRVVRGLISHGYLSINGISRYGTNDYKIDLTKLGHAPERRPKMGRPETGDSGALTGDSGAFTGDSGAFTGDSGSPYPSLSIHKPLIKAVDKNVIKSANQTMDAILEIERKAQSSWQGREKLPEVIRDLADEWVNCTGIKPQKKELSWWLVEWSDWLSLGVKTTDIRSGVTYAKEHGFDLFQPASLTKTLRMLVAKRSQEIVPVAGYVYASDLPEDKTIYGPNPYSKPARLQQ